MTMRAILHSFSYGLDYLRDQVADVPAGDMATLPRAGGITGIASHPSWVIGHLTFTCQMLGGAIAGEEPWLPTDFASRYGAASVPLADSGRYELKGTLLEMLAHAEGRILRAVRGSMTDKSMRRFPTRRTAASSRPSATRSSRCSSATRRCTSGN
jgi:hypothetical protein